MRTRSESVIIIHQLNLQVELCVKPKLHQE